MSAQDGRWRQAILAQDASVEQVICNLDQVAIKIVLVVDENEKLVGTISDGDVRRGLLRGLSMASSIVDIIHRNALVVPPEMGRALVRQLMVANKIQQIPIVDAEHQLLGLHLWDEIASPSLRSNPMIIMAGGLGARMRPYTEHCPKPMLPIAGKPMLEHIIERAKLEGFQHFILSIHYLGHMIEAHFGDGGRWGVKIDYLRETSPLGTAGALSLLEPRPCEPFVVTNGDVMTDIRYGELLDFHMEHQACATMAVRIYEWQHPFGVVQTNGMDIIGFEEKPVVRSHINAGVYALSPTALDALASNERCDMPTLFERLKVVEQRTVAYPMHEPWLDVGRPTDLAKARESSEDSA